MTLDRDTFSANSTSGNTAAVLYLAGGQNNIITNNSIDGGYHGHDGSGHGSDAGPTNTDDGIVLIDATGDTISGNSIMNVFDAGVEGVNGVRSSTITNNTISNALYAGIAAYHCTAWEGDTISGNTISQTETAIEFRYANDSLCDRLRNPPTSPSFNNNVLANNSFSNPVGAYYAVYINLDSGSSVAGNTVSGNRIQGPMFLSPLSGFTIAPGNQCAPNGNVHC